MQPWTAARTPQGPPCKEGHVLVPVKTAPGQSSVFLQNQPLPTSYKTWGGGAHQATASQTGLPDIVTTLPRADPESQRWVTKAPGPITTGRSKSQLLMEVKQLFTPSQV